MTISRRKEIGDYLKTQLSEIDGAISPFDSSYTFTTNLLSRVHRGIRFHDEINDFPSIYIQLDEEIFTYHTDGLVEGSLPVVIRFYVKSGTSQTDIDNLAQDIEHVLDNLPVASPDNGILDILIDNISTDEGLVEPFGIGETFVTVQYELE